MASETGNGGARPTATACLPSHDLLASRLRESSGSGCSISQSCPAELDETCTAAQPLPVVTAMAGVIFGGPGIIAGGFATYFLRRATSLSLPIWQSLGLCGVIYKAGLVILSRTCLFSPGRPPSAAVKERHLFGDSWAARSAPAVACVTAACLTASFALCALGGLNLWWHGSLALVWLLLRCWG